MSNIVAFRDAIIPGEANPDMVEELERLLEQAKSGRLQAFAYCTVRDDDRGTGWSGNAGTRDGLGLAIMLLHHRYADAILYSGDECP